MKWTPFLFELSGEHPSLPSAEVRAATEAECGRFRESLSTPGVLVIGFETEKLHDVASRLGLCHRAGRYLGSCGPDEIMDFARSLEVPEGSIAVRAKRFQGNHLSVGPSELSRKVGAILAERRDVDLENPEVEVRILISEGIHFFLGEELIDRSQFEGRKVGLRPFFSPISLHPRFARALVNLTGVKKGERLLDPFCGTGGILIEASLMGARVLGSDISEEMIQGCKENMEFFGAGFDRLERGDVGDIREMFGEVAAIATDPPYGRSTTTMREDLRNLHTRMMGSFADVLPPGRKLGLVLPGACTEAVHRLKLVDNHVQRVHRSLTRNYYVFAREPER